MSFVPPLQSGPAEAQDSPLDIPGPSNRLTVFPPEATLAFAFDGGDPCHVSERVPSDGIAVLASFHCLVDDRAAMRELTREIAGPNVAVRVLAGRPGTAGDDFRQYVLYARQIGGASEGFSPSRELAILLGLDIPRDARNRLRNGLLLVANGAIVWKSVSDLRRPDAMPGYDPRAPKPFDLDGLRAEIARRQAAAA